MSVFVALDEMADLVDNVGKAVGVTPASTVLQITALVLHGASGVARVVEADEVERIRQELASQRAGSEAAWHASHQDFHQKKEPGTR